MRPGTGPGPPAAVWHRARARTRRVPAHVRLRHGGSNQPRVSWRVCRHRHGGELQPSGDQCRNPRPRAAVRTCCGVGPLLSRCQAVTRPNTGHLAQDSAAHCKSLLTLIYNSALRAGAGRVLVGNISSVLTLHCVLSAGVWWLVQASIDRRLPRCQLFLLLPDTSWS